MLLYRARSLRSACGILFEILTRRRLHGGGREAIAASTLAGADARASAFAPDVPPELDAVCVAATSVDQARRFAGAREPADAVERYLDGDRDVERRRELAAHHVRCAREALGRAPRPAEAGPGETGHAEAMREVIQALALDAGEADARRLLYPRS